MFVIIGWIGAFLFIAAYLMLSIGILKAEGILYHLMNVLGAICLIINALALEDEPGFFVNFIWMLIGLFAITGIIRAGLVRKTE